MGHWLNHRAEKTGIIRSVKSRGKRTISLPTLATDMMLEVADGAPPQSSTWSFQQKPASRSADAVCNQERKSQAEMAEGDVVGSF